MATSKVNDPQEQRNCVNCNRPDHIEDMVACDDCSAWYHYGCADVNFTVKDQSWTCHPCRLIPKATMSASVGAGANLIVPSGATKKTKKPAGSKASTSKSKKTNASKTVSVSSSARARLALELEVLNEQQQLEELELEEEKQIRARQIIQEKSIKDRELEIEAKRLAEEKAFLEKKTAEELKFRRDQMAIKKRSLEEKAKLIREQSLRGSSRGSSVSQSESVLGEKVNKWLATTERPATRDPTNLELVSSLNKLQFAQQSDEQRVTNIGVKLSGQYNSAEVHPDLNDFAEQVNDSQPKTICDSARGMERNNEKTLHFSKQTYPQLHRDGTENENSSIVDQIAEQGPTNRQLAARQVMGKDLPAFSGNPEEWPIWISNFERSTATCGFSQDENLIRLQRCLKGPALEMVRGRLLTPASVPHVIKTLQLRYGRPETLIRALTERIRHLPPPKMDNVESIIDFGMAVDNLVEHLKTAKQYAHLMNPSLLHDLVGKLPMDYRMKWAAYKGARADADLRSFGTFMNSIVELAFDVADDNPVSKSSKSYQKPKDRGFVQAHLETSNVGENTPFSRGSQVEKSNRKICVACGMEGHRVYDCEQFRSLNVDERIKIVNQNSLCRTCLNQHGRWPCRTWQGCGISGCRLRHHTLLHSSSQVTSVAVSTSHLNQKQSTDGPLFRILPVTLCGPNGKVELFAFIDEGSQLTLLEDDVASKLGISGPCEPLQLLWTGNVTRSESKSQRLLVDIAGSRVSHQFKLVDARTVGKLMLPKQSLNYRDLAARYPHLRGLPINEYEEVVPKLLIGLDNLKLTIPLKIREGGWSQPIAAKCRLGWSIYGCSPSEVGPVTCGFHIGGWTNQEQELNQLVRSYVALDNSGIISPTAHLESDEERRAREILEATTRRTSTGFETGLLWKTDNVQLPNSYGMAYRRLRSLEKKLCDNEHLYEHVRAIILDYVAKQYAHEATEHELTSTKPEKCWYLPLGIVVNPRKSKVRLIMDARASVDGVSLNSFMLKGPDMLTSLPAVLSNFRMFQYALAADIKEMFHRIKIREEDRQFQRFLWRDQTNVEPTIFVMDVAIFGSKCSPSSAQYVKNRNAQDFADEYPRAADAIVRHHYVDDYLDSFGTEEEAITVGRQVKKIHERGGFEIRNFLSNKPEIAESVGAQSATMDKVLQAGKAECAESILGMRWIPGSDHFTYTLELRETLQEVLAENHIPTKREVLRIVMSLFDPLGLITFFLIHGRILMQDIWATGIGWDDTINSDLYERWRLWSGYLPQLSSIRVPRCYFAGAKQETYAGLQIHVFVDASELAYSSVVYFRVTTPYGVDTILVSAKSKVAPLKMLTIPRLELQAAVLGSRLLNSVIEMHDLQVTKRILWTDSRTVLAWLNSDHRKYHQFVGFRVAEILSTTGVDEWRWIPTKSNVADLATKWGTGPDMSGSGVWFYGPEFLRQPENLWPQQQQASSSTVEEIRSCNVHVSKLQPVVNVARFSRWERLQRTLGFVHRFIDNIRRRQRGVPLELGILTQAELAVAERSLWKQAQYEYYHQEVEDLCTKSGPTVSKSSNIYKLCPFLDKYGILRMRGRLDLAPYVPYEAKFPTILPQQSTITKLLVDWFHRQYRHAN
ncbi:uncharacterized protein LOC134287620 [Aedes albopictus]|uniref:PHD-type domain-containing protein n=1 Tax=Aedes albopictus TaxID=7160 RepID=A0ABM1ZH15_AEDAL